MSEKMKIKNQQTLKNSLSINVCNDIVELEGFEPSSKQVIRKLSTCLFYY